MSKKVTQDFQFYPIGFTYWKMISNYPIQLEVTAIFIRIKTAQPENEIDFNYTICRAAGSKNFQEYSQLTEKLYLTREQLICSYLVENIELIELEKLITSLLTETPE